MASKNIIFLDVDGVLNSSIFFESRERTAKEEEKNDIYKYLYDLIDDNAVANLQRIAEQTNAEIVLSSIWRFNHYENIKSILKEKGLKAKIIDKTPRCKTFRGVEIYEWIRENIDYLNIDSAGKFKNYVIIDDDDDMLLRQRYNFVQIDNRFGLTEKESEKAIEVLKSIQNE